MARPGNARDIDAERQRNAELEAAHGRCVVCHAPLEPPRPKRGGGHRGRETCSNRCRQYRHRHPDAVDRAASAGWHPAGVVGDRGRALRNPPARRFVTRRGA